MKFINLKPNILAGHSVKEFLNYNLYYSFAVFMLLGIQKLVIFPFIANKLGAERFGSFVLFMTIINTVIVVIPGCINLVILRVHSQYDKNQTVGIIKSGLLLNFILSLSFGIILFFTFPIIADFFNIGPIYKILLIPLAFYIIIFNLRETLLVLKRIQLKFKEIAFHNTIFALLFFLIIPSYYFFNENGIAFGYIFIGLIATLIVYFRIKVLSIGNITSNFLKIFYKFSPSFALVSLLELSLIPSSQYILSYYTDSSEVAYFFAATSVVHILFFPFSQIRTILLSYISHRKNLNEFNKKEINLIMVISIIVGVLLFIFGSFFGKIIITYLYGSEYYVHSKTALFIILAGYILNIFKIYLKNFIIVFFKRRLMIINAVITLFISIFTTIIFVPKYGINAAAMGISLSLITSAVMWYIVFITKLNQIKLVDENRKE